MTTKTTWTMSKRHNPKDKRPVPHALRPREHYTKKNGVWKAKMSFPDEMGANNYIRTHMYFLEHGYVAYQCSICGKYHIGFLNDKEE